MSSPTSPLCGPSTGVVDESVPSVLPEVDITKVRNLVFQGGSVKGVCYGGAVGALHKAFRKRDLHMHSEILNVAGTSAGALTAVAMAVGANVEELVQAMGTTDFKSFLDTKAYEIVESISSDTASTPQKTSAAMATLPLLTSSMGLSSGKGILEFVENFVKGRCGIDHLTFKELHELVLKARDEGQKNGNEDIMSNRGRCKDLFVVAYNLTTDQPMIFSYLETPDSIISDAVRCSMSIPYVFVPHKNYIKKASDKAGEYQRVEASDELWVDGGITDNYPIRVFDKVLEVPYGETLGFYLASKVEKAEFEGKPVLKAEAIHRDIRNLLEYAKAVTETIISSQQMSAHRQSGDRDRTIYIDYLGISMMNFGMTLDEKNSLIASGWDCVCERLGMTEEMGKCEVLLPTQKEDDEDTSNDSFDIDDEGVVTSSTSYGDRCVIF